MCDTDIIVVSEAYEISIATLPIAPTCYRKIHSVCIVYTHDVNFFPTTLFIARCKSSVLLLAILHTSISYQPYDMRHDLNFSSRNLTLSQYFSRASTTTIILTLLTTAQQVRTALLLIPWHYCGIGTVLFGTHIRVVQLGTRLLYVESLFISPFNDLKFV